MGLVEWLGQDRELGSKRVHVHPGSPKPPQLAVEPFWLGSEKAAQKESLTVAICLREFGWKQRISEGLFIDSTIKLLVK